MATTTTSYKHFVVELSSLSENEHEHEREREREHEYEYEREHVLRRLYHTLASFTTAFKRAAPTAAAEV